MLAPDRDVRPFQDVLLDLGARLGLPGMTDAGRQPQISKWLRRLSRPSRAQARDRHAWPAGAADGSEHGRGPPNPDQLERYIEHGCFWQDELAPEASATSSTPTGPISTMRCAMGFIDRAAPITLQLYSEVLQKFRLAAQGAAGPQPPREHRAAHRDLLRPAAVLVSAVRGHGDEQRFPLHAVTQRPMAMYHSWGSHERLAAPDPRQQPPLPRPRARRRARALRDDDWVWITSRHGRVKAQIRLMDGVNPDTCWTWNAIGKRAGAWNLAPDAPEATKGFLLNHLIDELLPEREGGYRYANADPVTGQAAWYDLRVRVEQASAAEAGVSAPQLRHPDAAARSAARARRVALRPAVQAGSAPAMTSLPSEPPARRLGLVIDLDTCVGCQACVIHCKEWNTGGYPAPLTDQDPYGARPRGALLNRVHGYEVG